jgi:hypothetical protein
MRFREVFQKITEFSEINYAWRNKKNIKPRMDPLLLPALPALSPTGPFVLDWFRFLFFCEDSPLSDKSACVSLQSPLTLEE